MYISRRSFAAGLAVSATSAALAQSLPGEKLSLRVGVISDEISQDLDYACYVISKEWGLHLVELREVWGKNLQAISDAQIAEAQKILAKYALQVTDISSPLFKVNWPDAPHTQAASKEDMHGADVRSFRQQDDVLERSISLARQFKTNKVRCFDFWRIDDVKPYRTAIDATLQAAAEKGANKT